MLRVILLILLVPIGFLAVRVGWPGLIPIVTITVAVYGFLLLKNTPSRTKIVFLSTAFVLQALLIAWGIRWTFQQVELSLSANGEVWPMFELFAGSDLLQNFWAIVGGVAVSLLLFGLLFALVTVIRAVPLGQAKKKPTADTNTLAWRRALGLVPAKWAARNGEIVTVTAARPPQQPMTGPGEIDIQRGHAVILEKEGTTRVLSSGVRWVNDKERISMLVPLFGRGANVVVRNATTLDGLQIETMEITIFHGVSKVRTPPGADNTASSQPDSEGATPDRPYVVATPQIDLATEQEDDVKFAFNEEILRNQVWSASGNTWEAGVTAVTEREARDVIAGRTMEEIVTMNPAQRNRFKKDLEQKINAVTKEYMGVDVKVTGVGTITIPDLAAEKLMARWTVAKDLDIAQDRATAENDIMVKTATARKDAFVTFLDAMNNALAEQPDVRNLLTMSVIERMERVVDEEPDSANPDIETLGRLYVLEALRSFTGKPVPLEGQPQAKSAVDLTT